MNPTLPDPDRLAALLRDVLAWKEETYRLSDELGDLEGELAEHPHLLGFPGIRERLALLRSQIAAREAHPLLAAPVSALPVDSVEPSVSGS